jgi:two-component system chemotaxis response regulator CheV
MLEIDGRLIMMLDFEAIIERLDARHQLSVAAPPPQEIGIDRERIRIFLAEDSQTIRRQIASTLASGGYTQVTSFSDGKSCWEAIENARNGGQVPCDLLVSDIEMPQMDGYGLCRRVKNDSQLSGVPVFLFSSMISDRTRFRGEDLGADEQITKPQLPQLVEIIDRWAPKLGSRQAA